MSHPIPSASAASPSSSTAAVAWPDAARHAAFDAWLAPLAAAQDLRPDTLRPASADASFRRYLRIDTGVPGQSCVVMDAPPDKENCRPFVQVQALMQQAVLHVPQILAWDEANGFMLLSDLGAQTIIEKLDPTAPATLASTWLLGTRVGHTVTLTRLPRAGPFDRAPPPDRRRTGPPSTDLMAARSLMV